MNSENIVNIRNYFSIFEKYTFKDIEVLQKVAIDSEKEDKKKCKSDQTIGDGRCSTALASLCFATIETLGLLTSNLNLESINHRMKKGNRDNALQFFNYFNDKLIDFENVPNEVVKFIYTVFRNRITHNLFPVEFGVAQNITNPTNKKLVIQINDIGSKSLNINFLSSYVVDSFLILKHELFNNDEVADLLAKNYQLIKVNENKFLQNIINQQIYLM